MMSRNTHLFHLLILCLILGIGVGAFFTVTPNRELQLLIGIATSVAYTFWGLLHHGIQHELHRKVVVEYVLMGTIAIIVLWTVLGS